jgi:hypothetical protein
MVGIITISSADDPSYPIGELLYTTNFMMVKIKADGRSHPPRLSAFAAGQLEQ